MLGFWCGVAATIAASKPDSLTPTAIYDAAGDPTVASMISAHWPTSSDLTHLVSRTLRMHPTDANALASHLSAASVKRYFEWGSGGSTELASWLAMKTKGLSVDSVDNNAEWLQTLRNDSGAIRLAEAKGGLRLHTADTGTVGAWGNPDDWKSRPPTLRHKQGSAYVDNAMDASGGIFDLVLIDGRFRTACALKALQHVDSNSVVLVHDFFAADGSIQRAEYASILDWYDQIQPGALELAILKPKPEALTAAEQSSDEYVAALNHVEQVTALL